MKTASLPHLRLRRVTRQFEGLLDTIKSRRNAAAGILQADALGQRPRYADLLARAIRTLAGEIGQRVPPILLPGIMTSKETELRG